MASPSTVITLGFGSFGSVNLLPTLGFGIGALPSIGSPGLEYSIGRSKVDYRIGVPSRLHYTTEPGRLHYTTKDEDE